MQLPNQRDIPMKPIPERPPIDTGNPPFLPPGPIQRSPSPFSRKPPAPEKGPVR